MHKTRSILSLALLLTLSGFTFADTETDIRLCAMVNNDIARLQCFDKLAKRFAKSPTEQARTSNSQSQTPDVVAAPPVVQVPVAEEQDERVRNFGKAEVSDDRTNSNEVVDGDSVSYVVRSAKKDHRKKWVLTFENGQVWTQTDSNFFNFKSGDVVVISKGALGGYRLSKEGSNRGIKVKRKS